MYLASLVMSLTSIVTMGPAGLFMYESAASISKISPSLLDALPSHGGETQVRVSQSQVAELGLGSTLPASNSRKG